MWEIPVFKAEKEAGIADIVRSTASVMCSCDVELDETPNSDIIDVTAKLIQKTTAGVSNPGQIDLYYIKTLLVSTGWNKNNDYFTKAEVWTARTSPEDKPINHEHDMSDIIGHITSNYVVDDNKNLLDDKLTIDELPDSFHIITGGVLYKHWEDETRQERMTKIIAEIKQNKWYVSMEALFRGFDYAVLDKENKFHVVARTEDSAFLTKHLKAYGGTGKYGDYTLGRIMRNLLFSGKGLVKKPANDKSIIFNSDKDLLNIKANNLQVSEDLVYTTSASTNRENLMSADTKVYEDEIRELKNALAKANEANHTNEISVLKATLEDSNKRIEVLKADLNKATETSANLTKEVEATKTELKEANELIQETQASIQHSERISFVMATLAITDKAKAEAFVEKWSNLDDEAFKALASDMGNYMNEKISEYKQAEVGKGETLAIDPATKSGDVPTVPSAKVTLKKPVKTVPNAGGAPVSAKEHVVNMTAASETPNLDNAEPVKDVNLSVAAVDEETESVRASILEWYDKKVEARKNGRKAKR